MILNPDETILFWGGPLSQWRSAAMMIDGVLYNCCEQYMMAEKARLFRDQEMLEAIMITNDPSKQKAMGRNVRGFDKVVWEQVARLIVYRANLAKFSQNSHLLAYLQDTKNKLIVEASPTDTIWGIGLAEDNPDCLDTDKWRGTNWLGEAIMQVRSDLFTMDDFSCFQDVRLWS